MKIDLHTPHHPHDAFAMFAVHQFGVMDSRKSKEIRAATFKKFEIAGMVDHAGKIGVGIIDARFQPVTIRGNCAGYAGKEFSFLFTMIAHHAFLLTSRLTGNRRVQVTAMTSLAALIKQTILGVVLSGAAMSGATAADFQPRRGINLDQWVTWPGESQWAIRPRFCPSLNGARPWMQRDLPH
jgi:hypothetical protein